MSTSPTIDPSARSRTARVGRARIARALLAGATATVVAAGLALAGAGSASAVQGGGWGTFTVTGTARDYTGTMTLPGEFPATTFTSTSRQATVISGATTWQAVSTPPGAEYGSSVNRTYLNQRPQADSGAAGAAVTTYTFASPTPSAGWSFVLGDIDADLATVSATDASGARVDPALLGFQGAYNYCHRASGPSCDSANLNDVPTYDEATGTLTGNPGAADTEGASGWFSPTVPLSTLTITYQQRSGFPVYQTWFGTKTFAASGTATLDGAPLAGATATVTDAGGRTVATVTTDASGVYSVPALTAAPGYRVVVTPPPGSAAQAPLDFSLADADRTGLDFAFTTTVAPPAPVDVTGSLVSPEGTPIADATVAVLPAETVGDTPVATTATDASGSFTVEALEPETDYRLVVADDPVGPRPFTTGTGTTDLGAIVVALPPVTPPVTDPVPPVVPPVTTPPTTQPPSSNAPVVPAGQAVRTPSGQLAYTGSEPAVPLGVAGVLLALGLALVGGGLVARRRR